MSENFFQTEKRCLLMPIGCSGKLLNFLKQEEQPYWYHFDCASVLRQKIDGPSVGDLPYTGMDRL